MLVGFYDEDVRPGNCHTVGEKLGDHLMHQCIRALAYSHSVGDNNVIPPTSSAAKQLLLPMQSVGLYVVVVLVVRNRTITHHVVAILFSHQTYEQISISDRNLRYNLIIEKGTYL